MSSEKPSPDDPVEIINAAGRGQVLLLCEHASNHIPARYNGLGLDSAAADSHAAWDPGARELALALSKALDAPLVAGTVSRLVYDCNRPPSAASAMPERSELIDIPGNVNLTQAQRREREETVYIPFCQAVQNLLDQRMANGAFTALVTIHSFTPVFYGKPRSVEIGILHDADSRLADGMLVHADNAAGHVTERNAPYGPEDGVTHSLIKHGLDNKLPNVMIEVRNDLLTSDADIDMIANALLAMLRPALQNLAQEGPSDA